MRIELSEDQARKLWLLLRRYIRSAPGGHINQTTRQEFWQNTIDQLSAGLKMEIEDD